MVYIFSWLFKIVSKGKGSIQEFNGKTWIYVPKSLAQDTAFPFKKGDKITIEIKEEHLIVCALKGQGGF